MIDINDPVVIGFLCEKLCWKKFNSPSVLTVIHIRVHSKITMTRNIVPYNRICTYCTSSTFTELTACSIAPSEYLYVTMQYLYIATLLENLCGYSKVTVELLQSSSTWQTWHSCVGNSNCVIHVSCSIKSHIFHSVWKLIKYNAKLLLITFWLYQLSCCAPFCKLFLEKISAY